MTKLTNKGKIKRLRKLLWFNFRYNFMSRHTYGLCGIYEDHYNRSSIHNLLYEIPELYEFRHKDSYEFGFWWSRGRVVGWWYRHWAIVRTIWKLRKL